jgi:putative acyl-CoA dehydrogenase
MALILQAALLLRHGTPEVAEAFCELRLGEGRGINYGAGAAPIGTDAILARQTVAAL